MNTVYRFAEIEDGADKRSQSERAFQRLRASILDGSVVPGQRLKIEALQRDFSLSSTPLREALTRLTVEGLVVAEDNRGFRVAQISASDLRDITRLRVLIEGDALAASMEHGDAAWEARVVAAQYRLHRLDNDIASGKAPRDEKWTAAHKEFHMALVSACTFPRLIAMCDGLFDQSERYRRLSARIRTVPRATPDEHRLIMDTVLARKSAEAVQLLVKHVEHTTENVTSILGSHASMTTTRGDKT